MSSAACVGLSSLKLSAICGYAMKVLCDLQMKKRMSLIRMELRLDRMARD